MTASELKSMINEMGGYDNVFSFIFDNQMCIYFSSEDPLLEEDITTLGGVDVFKHKAPIRSKSKKRYDNIMVNVHPLECLQGIQFAESALKRDDVDFTEKSDLHA